MYGKAGRHVPKARLGDRVWPYLYAWEKVMRTRVRKSRSEAERASAAAEYDDSAIRGTDMTFAMVEADASLKDSLPDGFYRWACFNFKENLKDFVDQLEEKDNWWRIATQRADGYKLGEIGLREHLTSERIRQICNLLVGRARQKGGVEIVAKLAAMHGRTDGLTYEMMEEELGRKSRILIYLLTSLLEDDPDWYVWDDASAIILEGGKEAAGRLIAYVRELPGVIPARDVPGLLEKAGKDGFSPKLVEQYIKHVMSFDGHNYHKGSIQTQDICEDIMRTCFADGIYIYDHESLETFRRKAREKYGPDVPVPGNDHAMTVLLNRISMLRDRGIYVPIRSGVLPETLLQAIRDYMAEHGQVSYMYNTIFGEFRDQLLACGVDNRYYLQGILRQDLGEGYTLTRDYITTNQENKKLKDPVIQYIRDAGRMVTKDELSKVFHTSPYLAYNCALMDRSIINYFGQYMHVDNLHLTERDRQNLRDELEELLSDGDMHETKELLKVIRRKYPELVAKAHLDAPYPLFSLLYSLFFGDYVLNRPYMALPNSAGAARILAIRGEPGTRTKAHTSMPKYRKTAGPEEILQRIRDRGAQGISLSELHSEYHVTKQYLLSVCDDKDMILIGERAVYAGALEGLEEAKEVFYQTLKAELDARGVVRRGRVNDLMLQAIPSFFERNGIAEPDAAFHLTRYIFLKCGYRGVEWYFHPHNRSISLSESNSDVTLMGQVTAYCREIRRPVTMKELVTRLESLGFNTDNIKYNLHLCEDPFIFICEPNTYVLVESLGITDKWLREVARGVKELFRVNGKLVPYARVEDAWLQSTLPRFPGMNLTWNRYLLQQVCMFYSDRVGARTIRSIGMYDFNRLHAFILPAASPIEEVGDAVWHYLKGLKLTGSTYTVDELLDILRREKILGEDDRRHGHKLERFLKRPDQYQWNTSRTEVTVLK